MPLPEGYSLRRGSSLDRALLVKFMQRTYSEVGTGYDYSHLAITIDQYLSEDTPLWWVDAVDSGDATAGRLTQLVRSPLACLWLGNAIDQIRGDRHTHIFLLYVDPNHRRQGIGTALMQQAEDWALNRGDRQIGLQVFQSNQAAQELYRKQGYQSQSVWMVKSLQR